MVVMASSREAVMAKQLEEVFNIWRESELPKPTKGGTDVSGEELMI